MPPRLCVLFALPLTLYSPVLHAEPLSGAETSGWQGSTRPLDLSLSPPTSRSSDPEALPALPSQFIVKHISPYYAEIENAVSGLSLRASSVAGSGVLQPGDTFLAGPLTPRNSWRRRVEIGYAPAGLEDIGLVLKAVMTEDREPWQFAAQQNHGVTARGQWQQSQSSAISLKFALLDSRIRYSGGISSSRYGEASVSASLTPDNPLYGQPPGSRGTMQWHRVDARLWEGASGNSSAYFSYADVGLGYRTLQQSADMPFAVDGRTVEFGAKLSATSAKLSLMRRAIDSVYGRSDVSRGSMALGPVRVTLSREGWMAGDSREGDGWQSRRLNSKAAVRISLSDLLRPGKLAAILPDSITLKMSNSRRERGQPGHLSLTESNKLGLELERTRGSSVTRIGIAKGITRRAAVRAGPVSQVDETWLDLSHSTIGEEWDLVAYGSINLRNSAGRTDRFYYGGLSLSVGGVNQPKLSIGIDADYFASRGDIAAFDVANRGMNISAAADFSYLLKGGPRDRSRYLQVKAFTDWSKTATYGEAKGKMIPTVLVMFGRRL